MTAAATRWGAFSFLADPDLAVQLAGSGLDWLCLDGQHGRFDDRAFREALARTAGSSARVLARVRALDAGLIGRVLDAGATGVIVPLVDGPEQAAQAVRAVRYPPEGARSFGPLAAPYGSPADTAAANRGNLLAVMIETAAGLAAVDAIAAVPGVDMLFVGPFDLSLALGTEVDALLADEAEDAPLRRVVAAAAAAGIAAGAFGGTPERARALAGLGFEYVAAATDVELVDLGVRAALRAAVVGRDPRRDGVR
jgi:4-hydroxy-2-oxoheptanedioate aldolase